VGFTSSRRTRRRFALSRSPTGQRWRVPPPADMWDLAALRVFAAGQARGRSGRCPRGAAIEAPIDEMPRAAMPRCGCSTSSTSTSRRDLRRSRTSPSSRVRQFTQSFGTAYDALRRGEAPQRHNPARLVASTWGQR
jgi:hypothetical protein